MQVNAMYVVEQIKLYCEDTQKSRRMINTGSRMDGELLIRYGAQWKEIITLPLRGLEVLRLWVWVQDDPIKGDNRCCYKKN